MVRRTALSLLLLLSLLASPLLSANWAEKMFETTRHDFGSVARAAKAEYRFVLKNIYVEDVHVASVRSSCGCTEPRIETPLLKTYEEGAIVAHLNTDRFTGSKGATITVTFDKPYWATVQLHVTSYIRRDVGFEPGAVHFGTVDQGTAAERTVKVTHDGNPDWQITGATSDNPHVSAEFAEAERRGGQVAYELHVRLDEEAPSGSLRDCLMLTTNDANASQIPLSVEGVVQSEVMVAPASLFLGVVARGKKVTKQVVVRAKRPFRILSVTCEGHCFEFEPPAETGPKPLHLIPITFVAGENPGKVLDKIRIETDLDETAPELSAYAVIAP
jgi:hypothetical protein